MIELDTKMSKSLGNIVSLHEALAEHGRDTLVMHFCGGHYRRSMPWRDDVLADARAQPGLLLDGVQPMPLPALQSAFDPVYPAGDQWYWRGDFVTEIPDAAIEVHRRFAATLPTWKSTMRLYPIDGVAHRIGPADTPWAYRHANWAAVIAGVDPDPANAEAITRWTVEYWEATHPYSAGGAYVNFMMDEGQDRVKATYGANYDRLTRVKAKYDSKNLFRVNQNIRPA
jgi:hypothetical protein